MNRFAGALAGLLLLSTACVSLLTDAEQDGPFVVASGTYFGMCLGYCVTELTIDGTRVRFRESSHSDPQRYPARTHTLTLTEAEWDRIRTFADQAAIVSVEGVHGCPDCADGGGEWVEIRTPTTVIRTTYEYGRVLAPIASLQQELRALRQRFM